MKQSPFVVAAGSLLLAACAHKEQAAPVAQAGSSCGPPVVCIKKEPVIQEKEVVKEIKECGPMRAHFQIDSTQLMDDDKAFLQQQAECLKSNPSLQVTITGNADERGSDEYNMKLGEARAQVVADFLKEQGVPEQQLVVSSNGKEKPLCSDATEDCYTLNRRVTIQPNLVAQATPPPRG